MLNKIVLHRFLSGPDGTFGVMTYRDRPLCVTCENPWFGNKRNISCIPNGEYDCIPFTGTRYKNVWILENVKNRSAILIHQGNTIKDTDGCILVGNSFGTFGQLPGVSNSVQTLDMLRRTLPSKFRLRITGPDGLGLV